MTIFVTKTADGEPVLATDEHPVCDFWKAPVVAIGDGPDAAVLGKAEFVHTTLGYVKAALLVIDWAEAEERSEPERSMVLRFLKDTPAYL